MRHDSTGRLFLGSLLVTAGLAGCATVQQPNPPEAVNRKLFAFNEALDTALVKPAATAYRAVLPAPVRTAASNFFGNLGDAWSAANLLLQGRVADGLSDVMRVGSNTVFGLLGLADVATEMGLPRHGADFGQTLGRWGFNAGAYVVWPVFGPSTIRDSVALPLEWRLGPEYFAHTATVRNALPTTHRIDTRANYLDASKLLDDIAWDKYEFVRDAYLARRRSLICDCDPSAPDANANGADPDPTAAKAASELPLPSR